jgi:CBS-domain-containing membrane protein
MNIEKVKSLEVNTHALGLAKYLKKMKGRTTDKSSLNYTELVISATGGLIAMTMISIIAIYLGYPMVLGPIAASSLLIFGAHNGPFSQPRQIIGGHLIASFASLTIWDVFGRSYFTMGITLAVVIILIVLTNTIHPPAAASAIVAINTGAGWGFIMSILLCSTLLVLFSVLYNNLFESRQYPKYWL